MKTISSPFQWMSSADLVLKSAPTVAFNGEKRPILVGIAEIYDATFESTPVIFSCTTEVMHVSFNVFKKMKRIVQIISGTGVEH